MSRYLKGILGTVCSVGMMIGMSCTAYADVPFITGGTVTNEVQMVETNTISLPSLNTGTEDANTTDTSVAVSGKKNSRVIDRTEETLAAEEAAAAAASAKNSQAVAAAAGKSSTTESAAAKSSLTEEEAAESEEAAASEKETAASADVIKAIEVSAAASTTGVRSQVVEYALSFVGGRYVYGGTDPHTGVDCSGFTSYILKHAAGVSLSHSSGAQSRQGTAISSAQMQPGDLLFYGSSASSINHVAIYIGSGKIVHASTAKTGIKVSNWNYRNPVKIVSVLGA